MSAPGNRFCPACGRKADDRTVYCSGCGTRIPEAEPQKRACPKCGSELDDVSPFCWKCGAAVAATTAGYERAMQKRDQDLERQLGLNPSRGSRGWLTVTVVLVALVVFLAALVVGAWSTGAVPLFGNRNPAQVTVAGANETLLLNGQPYIVGKAACLNCPLSGPAGSTLSFDFVYANPYPNATLTYASVTAGGGFHVTSSTPSVPFVLAPGASMPVTYGIQLGGPSGVYFVPLTISVTFTGSLG